jgi:hypothetical protein
MLIGAELIAKIKDLNKAGVSNPREQAVACGYVTKQGRVKLHAFYHAALEAKGLRGDRSTMGRAPSWQTKVQSTGNLLLGRNYVLQAGAQPGTKFAIEVSKGRIVLTPELEAS